MHVEFIIDVYTNEYSDGPSKAKVAFDKKDILWIKKASETCKKLKAYSIKRFDGAEEFYSPSENEVVYTDEKGETYALHEDFHHDTFFQCVDDDSVHYEGIEKYNDSPFSTESISIKKLLECYKVMTMPASRLPLLVNTDQCPQAKGILEQRLKGLK